MIDTKILYPILSPLYFNNLILYLLVLTYLIGAYNLYIIFFHIGVVNCIIISIFMMIHSNKAIRTIIKNYLIHNNKYVNDNEFEKIYNKLTIDNKYIINGCKILILCFNWGVVGIMWMLYFENEINKFYVWCSGILILCVYMYIIDRNTYYFIGDDILIYLIMYPFLLMIFIYITTFKKY